MIITFLLNFASSFVTGFANLTAGVATLPTGISDSFTYMVTAANTLNYIIPISSLFGALAIVMAYEAAIWTFKGAVWIYRHIPFIGH